MVDVALKVYHRDDAVIAARREVIVDACLRVAHEAVAFAEDEVVTDAERVGVHAEHRAGLDRGLAVTDLRRRAVDDVRDAAETRCCAGPARLRPRRVVEEERVEELLREESRRAARAVERLQHLGEPAERFDLGGRPVLREQHAATVERIERSRVKAVEQFGKG